MARLSPQSIDCLPRTVQQSVYDRQAQKCGIVHFGIGAFHRAHQAVYTEDAMDSGDRDWGITGVSLRSPDIRNQLLPQDGLYTVVERSAAGSAVRLIGAIHHVLVAPENPAAIVALLASADTRIVSFTVTEKGYCRSPLGGLNTAKAEVSSDLRGEEKPQTLYGFLARGLALRRAARLPGLTLLSCDNLANNGAQLAALLHAFLEMQDSGLARWVRAECRCPSTMVDRIVPATTAADRDSLEHDLTLRDEAAVVTEPFRQWVIEDNFAGPRPQWEAGGAQFVADVTPFETAKLRLLNGAHSALAYLGLARGHQFVHQAIDDPHLRPLVERMMREEAATSLAATPGQDSGTYIDSLIARFCNPALPHRLAQIAMDGSQKIPQRWLETLAFHQKTGRSCPVLLRALAAWIAYVRGVDGKVDDPMAADLAGLWQRAGREGIVQSLFGAAGVFAKVWQASAEDQRVIMREIGDFLP